MNPPRALSEAKAKALLAEFGVLVTREVVVGTADEAIDAARDIGHPVVVKLCGEDILHKTELNGVRLGLSSDEAVRTASQDLMTQVPGAELLVAEQVSGAREMIAGVTRDPQFGPTLMFGLGGVFAELLGDVVFRLLPLDEADIRSMFSDLENPGILGPFRGEPAVDLDELTASLIGISECAASSDEIESIDVNPLIICEGRPIAVDALVVLQ